MLTPPIYTQQKQAAEGASAEKSLHVLDDFNTYICRVSLVGISLPPSPPAKSG